jgi:hypothetical protein
MPDNLNVYSGNKDPDVRRAHFDDSMGYVCERQLSSTLPLTPEAISLALTAEGRNFSMDDILELYTYIHYTDNVDWDRLMAYFEGMKRRTNSG